MTFDEKTHQLTAYFCSISCVVGDGLVRMIIIVGLERKGRSNNAGPSGYSLPLSIPLDRCML
jgi:hypothetical protein